MIVDNIMTDGVSTDMQYLPTLPDDLWTNENFHFSKRLEYNNNLSCSMHYLSTRRSLKDGGRTIGGEVLTVPRLKRIPRHGNEIQLLKLV